MEEHLNAFHRVMDAVKEIQSMCSLGKVTLGDVNGVAQKHRVQTPELLSQLQLNNTITVDYSNDEVTCL